jgi:site-specific recombinase XerD
MRRWEQLVEKYIKKCRIRGLVKNTIEQKEKLLYGWGIWLRRRRPTPKLEEVCRDTECVINYIKSRSAFRSKSSTYSIISNLRCMGEFLMEEGIWEKNPFRWIRGPKVAPYAKLPKRISRSKLEKLLKGAAEIVRDYDRSLMLVILTLLYGTGMRRGELERLHVSDWNREQALISVDGKKTGRERIIPVPELTFQSIEDYLPKRQNLLMKKGEEHERLLINQYGRPLGGGHISTRISRLCRRMGLETVTMHQFRHSCASDLLESNVGLAQVREVLGHASLSTTYRYTAVSAPERKEAMALHPINRLLCTAAQEGGTE